MVIPYSHASVRLTGRWKQEPDRAVTTAPGSYLEFAFSGDMAVIRFDTAINQTPHLHLWIQLDGGDRIETPVDSYLRVCAETPGVHICRVIFKGSIEENNILYPICAVNFSREEWYGIYEDAKDYAPVFGVEMIWDEAEKYSADKKARTEAALSDGEIILGGGHMTVPQLEALLNTLPIEITFVDDNNINRFFNEGPKVFKRPQMAIDREVFSCHPPKIEPMVRAILDDFRNNKRDRVPVWMEKNGKPFLVTYMAVRDKKGNYLGTVEVVQDMQFAKEHFEQ